MKKILIMILLLTSFFTFAQDGFPDAECRKAYEAFKTAFLKKDWNGFDGKGSKTPSAKLIYKGVVDFPYYDSNEYKKKYLRKIVEIYKYEPALDVSFIIPTEKLDFCSSPELACLSYGTIDIFDYRNRTPADWEELKEIVKEKRKPSLSMYYKMCLKTEDGEAVAIINSTDWPTIMFKPKDSDKWELIHRISFQENVLFYVINDNLYLEELPGTHDEKIEAKLKAIMSNKLTLPPDIEERLAREEAERKAKLSKKASEDVEIELTPEEKRMNEALNQIFKNVEEGKADPPEIKAIFGDEYPIYREDAEKQIKRIKEKEKIILDLMKKERIDE